MPVRLGQFYALVLLLACLATNIAFFAEVREPFLGDEDPTASVKSAFFDLDIQAKIAEFYPKTLFKIDEPVIDEVSESTPSLSPEEEKPVPKVESPAPQTERPASREPRRQQAPPNDLQAESAISKPAVESPTPPEPAMKQEEPETVPKEVPPEAPSREPRVPKSVTSAVATKQHEPPLQTVAAIPAPVPVTAPVQSAIAEQFMPIIVEPKPLTPVRPSSSPVWDTTDAIRDRPIRYD